MIDWISQSAAAMGIMINQSPTAACAILQLNLGCDDRGDSKPVIELARGR
jgi:hypothetical protein